jgi:DNA helicase-2/ATP-dependent DNA helicase PcrA
VSLNPKQADAVAHRGSPLLVLAGAGTGKTRVITHRIASLTKEGVDPSSILAVTFTNKAAKEMQHRLAGMGVPKGLWIGTFHSIGVRVLRQHGNLLGYSKNFTIYDSDAQEVIIKTLCESVHMGGLKVTYKELHSNISYAKDCGYGPDELHLTPVPEKFLAVTKEVFEKYNAALKKADAMDFSDLLAKTVALCRLGPDAPCGWLLKKFRYVLVDEFQDTNKLQLTLVDFLATKGEMCVVGDDDQSIYAWRGADPTTMVKFAQREGCKVVRLEDNYRSTHSIVHVANTVIAKNATRLGKTLEAHKDGSPVRLSRLPNEREEARYVANRVTKPYSQNAILYRTHMQSRPLEEAFRRAGIPYTIIGGLRFYDRAEIKDVFSYFRLALNPNSDVDLLRVANRPARGIGGKTLAKLKIKTPNSIYTLLEKTTDPKLKQLKAVIDDLHDHRGMPVGSFYDYVIKRTGYRSAIERKLETTSSNTEKEKAERRLENVDELASDISTYVADNPQHKLHQYMDHISLVSSADKETDAGVSFMTVHAAKGLEFPHVFLVGFEDGILPHKNSVNEWELTRDPGPIEEERRLTYVAITRAKERLDITMANFRTKRGRAEPCLPSRYMTEIPTKGVDRHLG